MFVCFCMLDRIIIIIRRIPLIDIFFYFFVKQTNNAKNMLGQ
jgi:hypothetical protein